MTCYREQERQKIQVDLKKLQENLEYFQKLKQEKEEILRAAMPKVPKKVKRSKPKNLYKKDKYMYSISDLEDNMLLEEDISIHTEADRQFIQMENALKQLGEPCRTIITDFYIHNRSMQDICTKFGYTNADNAKNQKYKCLQRLKKLFFGT